MDRQRGLKSSVEIRIRLLRYAAPAACLSLLIANVVIWRAVGGGWAAASGSGTTSMDLARISESRMAAVHAFQADEPGLVERVGTGLQSRNPLVVAGLTRALASVRLVEPGTLGASAMARTGSSAKEAVVAQSQASASHGPQSAPGLLLDLALLVLAGRADEVALGEGSSSGVAGSQLGPVDIKARVNAGFFEWSGPTLNDPARGLPHLFGLDAWIILQRVSSLLGSNAPEFAGLSAPAATGFASASGTRATDQAQARSGYLTTGSAGISQASGGSLLAGQQSGATLAWLLQQIVGSFDVVGLSTRPAAALEANGMAVLEAPAASLLVVHRADVAPLEGVHRAQARLGSKHELGVRESRMAGTGSRTGQSFLVSEHASARVIRLVGETWTERPSFQRGHVATIGAVPLLAARVRPRQSLAIQAATALGVRDRVGDPLKLFVQVGARSSRTAAERMSLGTSPTGRLRQGAGETATIGETVEAHVGRAVSEPAFEVATNHAAGDSGPAAPEAPAGETGGPDVIVVPRPPSTGRPSLSEVVAVVRPGRAVKVQIPEYGVALNIPGALGSEIFQTRLSIESPDSVPPPDGFRVARLINIEVFDAHGQRTTGPVQSRGVELVIRIEPREGMQGGTPRQAGSVHTGALRLMRYEPGVDGRTWWEIELRAVDDRSLVANLDHLSLFALLAPARASVELPALGLVGPELIFVDSSVQPVSWVAVLVLGSVTVAVATALLGVAAKLSRRRSED